MVGVHPISETSIGDCFYDDSQFVDFANPKSRGGSTPRPTGGFETARLYQTFESNMAGKSLFYGKKMENHLQIMADIRSPEGKKLFVFYLIRGWIFQPRHPFRGDDTVDGPAKSCTTKRIVETIKKKIPPNNW